MYKALNMHFDRSALEPKVKGAAFRTIEVCFRELSGADALERARQAMLPELRMAFESGTLLTASWYPISWYKDVFRAFRAVTGAGSDLARRIGILAVRHDMKGIHKQFFARLVSPQTLLGMSQRVFNLYYDTGKLVISESRSGFARMRCSNCLGWDEDMWQELIGSSESQLEMAGAKNIRMRLVSGGRDNDSESEVEARWT